MTPGGVLVLKLATRKFSERNTPRGTVLYVERVNILVECGRTSQELMLQNQTSYYHGFGIIFSIVHEQANDKAVHDLS